jgi:hypothetical protein
MTRRLLHTIGMAPRWESAWKAFSESGQITWGREGQAWKLALRIAAYEDWWYYHSLPNPCKRLIVTHWRLKLSLRRRWYKTKEWRDLQKEWLKELNLKLDSES